MQKLRFLLIVCALLISHKIYAVNKKYLPLSTPNSGTENRSTNTNELLKSYLEFSAFRHKVLSENIANINTPNYKAEDVSVPQKYEDLTSKARSTNGISLATTSTGHISEGKRSKKSKFAAHKIKDPYEIKPNGNNVSLAQQMTKVSQNQSDYNMAVKSYSTTNSLISAVLGK